MAIIHGKNLSVAVDGDVIATSKSCTINVTQGTVDTTSKADANWETSLEGMRSWTVSTDYLWDATDTVDPEDLMDLILNANGTAIEVSFGITSSGTFYWYGNAIPTGNNVTASNDAAISGDISFKGNGALNKASIALS